jgi:hypothetical protein
MKTALAVVLFALLSGCGFLGDTVDVISNGGGDGLVWASRKPPRLLFMIPLPSQAFVALSANRIVYEVSNQSLPRT